MGEVNGGGWGGQTRLGHHSVRRSLSLPIHGLLSLCLQGSAQAPPPPGGPGPSPPHPVSVLRAGAWLPQAPATTGHAERHCPTLWKGRQEALVRWAPPRLPEAQRRLVPAGDKSRGPPLHLRLSPGGHHHVSFSPPSSTQPLWESSGSRGCWGPRQSLGCLRSRAAHRHVAFKKRNCLSYYFLKKFLHLLKKKTLKC